MVQIEHSIVIRRPVREVFAFLTNPENNRLWQGGVIESRKTSEGPVGVGTRGEDIRKFLGREVRTTYEIVEYEAEKLGFRSLSGPIQFEGHYTLEAVDEGTRFTVAMQGDAGPIPPFMRPLATNMARKQVEADASSLKKLLESAQDGAD